MFLNVIRMLIYGSLFILIPLTVILLAFQQTMFNPYGTVSELEGTGIYEELHDILPDALQEYKELSVVTSDERLNEIFIEVVEEYLTVNRIAEILVLIEKDMWDYILGKDDELGAIDIDDIRSAFLEEAQRSERMQQETIYNETFIAQVEWATLLSVDDKTVDQMKMYYKRIKSLIIWNGLFILLSIGLSFFFARDWNRNLKWLSALSVIAGFTVLTAAILLNIIGIDWMTSGIELSGMFADLTDNIQQAMDRLFIDFLSAMLAFAGILLTAGFAIYSITVLKGNKKKAVL